jgi:circadian clock protein KaiB
VKKPQSRGSTADFQAAIAYKEERYELCLFIAGTTPGSSAALATVIAVCEERLAERYDLTVVDVYQEPARAKAEQIIAVPTLLKKRPAPVRRLIGDLSDRKQMLIGLGLPPERPTRHAKKEH